MTRGGKWGLLITWWDGAMENFGPFNNAMGKLETNKEMGTCVCVCRGVNYLMGKWEIGPLMAQWNIWALWWCNGQIRHPSNGKIGPLMTWWGNWEALDLLITWWEIRGHHFDDMRRKWGPLIAQWKFFGPFDDAMGKLETLNKAMGKLGVVNYLMGKWEIGPLMAQWNIWGPLMMQWAN